jgi:hypothetical protein
MLADARCAGGGSAKVLHGGGHGVRTRVVRSPLRQGVLECTHSHTGAADDLVPVVPHIREEIALVLRLAEVIRFITAGAARFG